MKHSSLLLRHDSSTPTATHNKRRFANIQTFLSFSLPLFLSFFLSFFLFFSLNWKPRVRERGGRGCTIDSPTIGTCVHPTTSQSRYANEYQRENQAECTGAPHWPILPDPSVSDILHLFLLPPPSSLPTCKQPWDESCYRS